MRISWTPAARRDVRALDQRARERVRVALTRLAADGSGDVKKLAGREEEWRLRVGQLRVRFTRDSDALVVLRVLHRREAYRD